MPDWLVQIAVLVVSTGGTGAAVYGGIRADLKRTTESVARAHARLDEHMNFHMNDRRGK